MSEFQEESVPTACPGVESNDAGKASACAGCPNQNICASGQPKAPDPAIDQIAQRLKSVKHKILVLSGKGGVGKSTVTTQLAHLLAENEDTQVGILDLDICGPSQPLLCGVEGEQVHQSMSGWSPVFVEDNLCLMSIAFLLDSLDDAVIWRGPKKNGMIKQFLRDVDWGELDYLLVDTPPGTSDEHISIAQYLKKAGIDGAVIVATPQEVSLQDIRKELNFCKKVGIKVLGIVENMGVFTCPKCKKQTTLFPSEVDSVSEMAKSFGTKVLGTLPFDPRIGKASDEGKAIMRDTSSAQTTVIYRQIVKGWATLHEVLIDVFLTELTSACDSQSTKTDFD